MAVGRRSSSRWFRSAAMAALAGMLWGARAFGQDGGLDPLSSRGGLFINPLWLALAVLSIGAWLYATSWASDDAMGVGLAYRKWTLVWTCTGFVGSLLIFFLHPLASVGMLLALGGIFAFYLRRRNAEVPAQFQILGSVLGSGEARPQSARGGDAEAERPHVKVELVNAKGQSVEQLLAAQPDLTEDAEALGDIIAQACAAQAMAFRIDPGPEEFRLLFRLDEVMQPVDTIEQEVGQGVIGFTARFLGLGGKGRARSRMTARLPGGREVPITVRGMKSKGGAAMLYGLPDWHKDVYKGGLEALGMHPAMLKRVEKLVGKPGTAMIVSSPPGRGKTSTFHAIVSTIDIFTTDVTNLETKTEHELDQVRREKVDLSSEEALQKALPPLLREEPDVLTADELVNPATFASFFEFAAQDGHFIGTLKADSSREAVAKLAKVLDGELVAETLSCVLNQRLIRRLCDACKEPIQPNPKLLAKLKIDPSEAGTWFRAVGCEECFQAGYRGRTGIYEMLIVGERVAKALKAGKHSPEVIKKAAGKKNLRSLYQDALLKVRQGMTTLEEVRRVLKK